MTEQEFNTQLNSFYGTTGYHTLPLPCPPYVKLTDGVIWLMENGFSWLVTDAMIVVAMVPEVKSEPFVSIKLKGDKVTYDNGNGRVLYEQEYMRGDPPFDVSMYYCDNVMLLPSEY